MCSRTRTYVWPFLSAVLSAALAGCGRAGGAANDETALPTAAAVQIAADQDDSALDPIESGKTAHLEQLRRQGHFDAFASAALAAAAAEPAERSLRMLEVEALLATGQDERAGSVALEAAALALATGEVPQAAAALRLWTVARFRQSLPCDDPRFADTLDRIPADEPLAELPRFWRDALRERAPYRLGDSSPNEPTELNVAGAATGSLAAELCAVEAKANGHRLPLVFIDTGAQHNLMTVDAAHAAGVALGSSATHMV